MPLKDFEKNFPSASKSVRNAILNKKTAHAYLVHCDDSDLAVSFSQILAQALACQYKTKDGDSCGKCKVCIQIYDEKYPELFILYPTSKSRKIQIGKDDFTEDSLRWFQSLFYLTSIHESGKKIGIIRDADRMTTEAQNAFLKTLEEPPPDSFFILHTAHPEDMLPTIRSRCQRITILRNSQKYNFDGADILLSVLPDIYNGYEDIASGEKAASTILSVLTLIKTNAEKKTTQNWEKLISQSENYESNIGKKLEERRDTAIQAEYLSARESVIGLIYCWFAQLYQLSLGITLDDIPNPEIMNDVNKIFQNNPERSFECLKKTENFVQTMKWNVDESLAVREFCLSIVFPE
jgi:DNA polymerase-3 subunit delta'